MLPFRTILITALATCAALSPARAQTEASRKQLEFQAAGTTVKVEKFGPCITRSCQKILILSGSKGLRSKVYDDLGHAFQAAGLDPYLVHYLSEDDLARISKAGGAKQRKAFYAERLAYWTTLVQSIASQLNGDQDKNNRIGILGISLGAQVAYSAVTQSSAFGAIVLVDGGFPENHLPLRRALPPALLLWGSEDKIFSVSMAKKIQASTIQLGGSAALEIFDGGEHDFFLKHDTKDALQAHQKAAEFLTSTLK
ncbi:dienelactone hydrolase family protein [Allorhizobium undicola]|uniref:dienelactone hydrolase family protein n=1 Tax=Allorhizobium undicola TaxID=78527 RepID=UPI003D32E54A